MQKTIGGKSTTAQGTMDDVIANQTAPTSFGVFKPVGSVMVGLPTQAQAHTLGTALQQRGWANDEVAHFVPSDTIEELEQMVENAGPLAGFGYELTLLRRYLALSQKGTKWLLVQVKDNDHAAMVAQSARDSGAILAVHYKTLTVEELL